MAQNEKVSICAVGDVGISREHSRALFAYTAEIFQKADIAFCQNERIYTQRSNLASRDWTKACDPKLASILKTVGFHVVSFTGNNTMKLGAEAMFDTIDILRKNGLAVVGAGENIKEARKPVIIDRKGMRVAFLGYASVIRSGEEATNDRSGCAPMRASTCYQQTDYQPGTPPKILTFANRDDLEAMKEDIKEAKSIADVVVVSMHWGIHFLPAVIAMYEKEVAHAAIDTGADLILGHHAHVLKGIELYKGKAIFYNMGNFAFDLPYDVIAERLRGSSEYNDLVEHYDWKFEPEWEAYPFPHECRKSMIVKCTLNHKQVEKVSFLPVLINRQAQPEVIRHDDKNFGELVAYMEKITISQKLDTKYRVEGDEVVICT